jgi:hypothetical protein
MFLDVNSIQIKVGNGSYINMGQYITEAKYSYNKLWSSDSGRNLAGTQSGTLIGIFPKIILQFRKLTKAELEIIVPILDSARQTVKYYDPKKKATVEMQTYTGDYEITNKGMLNSGRKNEGFSCSFIAIKKRT